MRRSAERSFTTLQLELPACQSVEEVCSDLEIQAETDFSVNSPPPHLSTPAPTRLSSGSQILLILVWPFSKQKPQNTLSQALTDLLAFPRLFACPKPVSPFLTTCQMRGSGLALSLDEWGWRSARVRFGWSLAPHGQDEGWRVLSALRPTDSHIARAPGLCSDKLLKAHEERISFFSQPVL